MVKTVVTKSDHSDYGTCFGKLGLQGADWVHLTKKGKIIFGEGFAKLVKGALNKIC